MNQTFIHKNALCESTAVGLGTRVWAFAHILPGAIIGRDCNICDHVFIENDVRIGDNVTIKCGVQLWDGINIGNNVFIGPNVTFTNDKFPRSKKYPDTFLGTVVRNGASIGANATILPGITIEEGAMVGAGAVVTRSVPRGAIVTGNPARISGYVGAESVNARKKALSGSSGAIVTDTHVKGVKVHELATVADIRGNLVVGEYCRDIPFIVKRIFMIHGVDSKEVRGEHAHRKCHQYLICINGSVWVIADDGKQRIETILDAPNKGIYLPPMVWGVQYKYTSDAILLVLASEGYDPNDYIRNYDEFIQEVNKYN
jgi:UDP-2-acetamido-3-amino-2,3-dideoxy-glucuronate N-acetyltransferase